MKDTTDRARSTTYLELNMEIKDTTDTARSTKYLELNMEIIDTTNTRRYVNATCNIFGF